LKPLALFFGLSAASLVVMVVVDFVLGAIDEFVAVLLANLAIGGMLAALIRFFRAGAA